jgi:uncharacterized NAD-dependent epimerase/dehydratase family protein
VGTDCAVGKKYTALAIEREMLSRGMKATFRATGQTGIMIAGEGIPIDAVVLCHEAGRTEVELWEGFSIPNVRIAIEKYLLEGRLTNPDIRCIGACINTSTLPAEGRGEYLRALEADIGLPCVDPLVDGVGAIVDRLREKE